MRAWLSASGGILRLGDGLVQFGDFLRLAVAFAELALDRRHLLAEDRLALALVEGRFCLLADFVAQPQHLDALGEIARDLLHPGAQRSIVSRISCFSCGLISM